MKPIPLNYKAHFELMVTEGMTVDFEQTDPRLGKLHPVYSTYWMVKHMELASRKLLLPFLDNGEEGIGLEVSAKHFTSALPGMRVVVTAVHMGTKKNRVYAQCEAVSELGDKLGQGETTQVIMPVNKLEQGFTELRTRWQMFREKG